jgi:hypothetical protein
VTRGVFACAAIVCVACGSAPPPAGAAAPPAASAAPSARPREKVDPVADAREARIIARTLREVSAIRNLTIDHPVPGRVLERTALIGRVKEHVAREVPPDALRREGQALQILGLVPEKFDYAAATFALLEQQLAGYYEPADATMYMAGDLVGDNADATLAHELVHALQDQHFDLKTRSKYRPGESDHLGASSALAEGDATSVMIDFLLRRQPLAAGKTAIDLPERFFVDQVFGAIATGEAVDTPHVMRSSLVAPYVEGTLFVHALRRKGGWAMVDRAWREPPTTSEQILHVAKWETHEPELAIAPPSPPAAAGWDALDTDTMGELGLRLLYEEWMPPDRAKEVAAGWGGDRAVLYGKGDEVALGMHVRFDAPEGSALAGRSFAWIKSAWPTAAPGGSAVGPLAVSENDFACVERPHLGPLAALVGAADLVLIAGPSKVAPAEWTATANCAAAKKWARAVLGAR